MFTDRTKMIFYSILFTKNTTLIFIYFLVIQTSKRLRMFLDLNEIIHAHLWKTPLIKRWQICFILDWYDKYYTLLVTLYVNQRADVSRCMNIIQHVHVPTHLSSHTFDLIITRSINDVTITSPLAPFALSDHLF